MSQARIQPTLKHVIVDCPQLDAESRCFRMPSSQLTVIKVLGEFLAAARLSVGTVPANLAVASNIVGSMYR